MTNANYPEDQQHSQVPPTSTAAMMAAYQGKNPEDASEDEGALAWTYLLVVGIIFLGLLFLAWSCQGDSDDLVGGLGSVDEAQTTITADDEPAATVAATASTAQSVDSSDTTAVDADALQTSVNSLLESTKILFEPNEVTISEGESVIEEVATAVADQDVTLIVQGYTDSVGDADENLALSRDRAEAVKDKLVAQGIEASRITTEGFGETEAVQENPTDEQKDADRRIEIVVEAAS